MCRLKFTTWKQSLLLENLGVWKEGKGWGNHLNAAITQLLTFQPSFLRRNWKQSNNTERHTETIIMAQKQKQKSFYVPFNKRKSDCETAASETQAHIARQGPGLGLFLFISQFPCLLSFLALLVAAQPGQSRASGFIQNKQAALTPRSCSTMQVATDFWTWKKLQVVSEGKGSKSPQSFWKKTNKTQNHSKSPHFFPVSHQAERR